MSDSPKQIVTQVCQHLSDRNLDALFALIHDEGSWSIPYREDRFAYAGFRDKAGLRELLSGFLGGFDSFRFDIVNIIAEGDKVAVEATSEGEGPAAAQYRNRYLLIFLLKDGKVHTVREHFDPYQVEAYVEQAMAQVAG